MHLLILGLVLVVGILVYYIISTSAGDSGASSGGNSKDGKEKVKTKKKHIADDLRKEDNVIYLPNKDDAEPKE